MRKRKVEAGHFIAADEKGTPYQFYHNKIQTEIKVFGEDPRWQETGNELVCGNHSVNRISKGRYELVDLGIIVTSNDPKAV